MRRNDTNEIRYDPETKERRGVEPTLTMSMVTFTMPSINYSTFVLPVSNRDIPIPGNKALRQATRSGDLWLIQRWVKRCSYAKLIVIAESLPDEHLDMFVDLLRRGGRSGQELLQAVWSEVPSRPWGILSDRQWVAPTEVERSFARLTTLAIRLGGRFGQLEACICSYCGGYPRYTNYVDPLLGDKLVDIAKAMLTDPDISQEVLDNCLILTIINGDVMIRQAELIEALLDRGAKHSVMSDVNLPYYVGTKWDLIARIKDTLL